MPFFFAHAGSKLQKVTSGGVPSDLTLPAGVTISTTRRARFAALGNFVVVAHAPSLNLAIDVRTGTVYAMSVVAPTGAVTAAVGAAGVLTGDYMYKVSYAIVVSGEMISESPLNVASAVVTLTGDKADLTNIPVSPDAQVTHRRIYRTTAGGSVFFYAGQVADNTTTTYTDNLADAGLSTIAAPTDLGNPYGSTTADYFRHIAGWKGRLWAASNKEIDRVFFSGPDKYYGWPAIYNLAINPTGQSGVGVNGFMPRRDELGVSKEEGLWKVVGTSVDNFQVIQVVAGIGAVAPESIIIIRDTAYFLAVDGVYSWGAEGLIRLSERVDPWFKTDNYFARESFADAFARWNVRENTYELHLRSVGSSVADVWVSYDLDRKLWLGPHKTAKFTPSCAATLQVVSGIPLSIVAGTNGEVYHANGTAYSDDGEAIDFDFRTAWHAGGAPNMEKVWGSLSVSSGIELAGACTIYPYVGGTDALSGVPITHDLTRGRERLRRLGLGRLMALRFQNNEDNQACRVYEYECPVSLRGTR
jgi:hypothetical protein